MADGSGLEFATLKNLSLVPVKASAGTTGRKTPVREFLIFPWGDIRTTQGTFTFDEECAKLLMERYRDSTERRDGWLDIDIAHLSQTNDDEPMAHISAGRFRTETRQDGQWVTDLTYTTDAYELVATEKFKYYSPVIGYDKDNRLIAISQLALTNIPSMYNAQPLALSDKSTSRKGILMSQTSSASKYGSFSRPAMAVVCLDARKARLEASPAMIKKEAVEAAKPHMMRLFQAMCEALADAYPDAHLEEVYEDHAVIGMPSKRGAAFESYAKVPYDVKEDGAVGLGEAINVVKKFIPIEARMSAEEEGYEPHDGDDSAKMEQLSQRLKNTEQMLLSATGKKTVSAAIGEIERLKTSGGKDLAEKVARLEARSFEAEKTVLLSEAKKSGKWTAKLEALSLSNAERARRLGDDPIEAMRETFDAAPVSVHPGRETPPQHESSMQPDGQLSLSAAERQELEADAKRYGQPVDTYIQSFLSNRKMLSRR